MQIKKTKIPGLKIVTNKIYKDSRGHFKEDFLSKNFTKNRFVFSCTLRFPIFVFHTPPSYQSLCRI